MSWEEIPLGPVLPRIPLIQGDPLSSFYSRDSLLRIATGSPTDLRGPNTKHCLGGVGTVTGISHSRETPDSVITPSCLQGADFKPIRSRREGQLSNDILAWKSPPRALTRAAGTPLTVPGWGPSRITHFRKLVADREALACCSPGGREESDAAGRWNSLNAFSVAGMGGSFLRRGLVSGLETAVLEHRLEPRRLLAPGRLLRLDRRTQLYFQAT